MGHMVTVAAMLFVLLCTSLGEEIPKVAEASLLQVSQAPALQAQPQGVQVAQPQIAQAVPQVASQMAPQAPLAQLVQSSFAAVPAAIQSGAPVAATMTAPTGSAPFSAMPVQAALTAAASGVKSAHAVQMNETALAFSQLASLDTEFTELHADDASHVRQLTYNVHLREQLQEKLRQARDQLAADNEHLADRTMQIIAGGDALQQPHTDDSQLQNGENGANETVAALLLEAAVVSRQHREQTNAQIAAQALDRVKSLVQDIAALRARDEEEIRILRANAEGRNALRKKIDERNNQLIEDTDLLMKDLGGIRDLVSKDDSTGASSTTDVAATAASPKQEVVQNEGVPNA